VRVVLLAAIGVAACVCAIVRYYRPRPPMIVPAAEDAGEIPAPELE
jgi:hypothetical protein